MTRTNIEVAAQLVANAILQLRSGILLLLLSSSVIHAESSQALEDCTKYSSDQGTVMSTEFLVCSMRNREILQRQREAELETKEKLAAEAAKKSSSSHSRSSYQRCIVKNMPDAKNDLAARAVNSDCLQYPQFAREPEADFFGYSSAKECFSDLGGETPSRIAALAIARACQDLYPGLSM